MAQQVRYNRTRRTPLQLLENAYSSLGKETAEKMGLIKYGSRGFNFQYMKTMVVSKGNVIVMDLDVHTNTSTDGLRHFGGFTGNAGINLQGQLTLQSTIPAIVIADFKDDKAHNAVVQEAFGSFCIDKKGLVGKCEVNPADVYLFQVASTENGVGKSMMLIEASGTFGDDTEGNAFYWSIIQHPKASPEAPKVAEETKKAPTSKKTTTNRTPQNRPTPSSSEQPELNAETEKELATVT